MASTTQQHEPPVTASRTIDRPRVPADTARARESSARRSAWRERLVEAEGGLRLGIRADGTLFVHLFIVCGIVAAGLVLGLNVTQWAITILAITVVLSAEIFNQMLRVLCGQFGRHLPSELRDTAKIGTTAVVTASIGAVVALTLVFGQCVARLIG
ncbi:MAG: hypothetical protein DWQ34_08265 [Planctomycetota bacterium]|nr:MAG: hypothetical protein DWQ29_04815 [Planctomycetota bacterium]REJ94717.1 MAG: hypothetical protein DWQ34_08265 [Planctomycetota bacterium]REK31322.1 MAG: hypothetical protein DWQ41_00270 [Planctomycetota bacterium]REK39047.1 MAG: hypothetical protein DWQ45_02310 [Planctomycetota bacterium]